ncbi:hypothetical protein SBA3_520002 [Candidatus Sulfopaludibacter sp. SbA3]|nr:hypothetical protein SBA3_520002 [Candidatus Sulfopaludibacter sp. SbA3]
MWERIQIPSSTELPDCGPCWLARAPLGEWPQIVIRLPFSGGYRLTAPSPVSATPTVLYGRSFYWVPLNNIKRGGTVRFGGNGEGVMARLADDFAWFTVSFR